MSIWLSLALLPFLATSLTVHEFAHAWSASLLGDGFARRNGRVSLNPFRHMSVMGTLAILLLPFGWAKPVVVNPYNFRRPRRDFLITSLAGPAANLLMVGLCLALAQFTRHSYALGSLWSPLIDLTHMGLLLLAMLNTTLCVINLVPIPPLDGSRIWPVLFPKFTLALKGKGNLICLVAIFALFSSHALDGIMARSMAFTQQFFPKSDRSLKGYHPGYSERGFAALGRHDNRTALREFDAAIAADNTDSEAYYGRAHVLYDMLHHEQALAAVTRAIELTGDEPRYYQLRSYIYWEMGRPAEALKDARQVTDLGGEMPAFNALTQPASRPATMPATGPATTALQHLHFGYDAIEAKNYTLAKREYETAMVIDPHLASAFYGRALAFYYENDLAKALQDVNKAIELSPRNGLFLTLRAYIYWSMGHEAQAHEDAQRAEDLGWQRPILTWAKQPTTLPVATVEMGLLEKGYQAIRNEDYPAALREFDAVIAADKQLAGAYYGRALAQYTTAHYEKALPDANRAIELAPRNATYFTLRSYIHKVLKHEMLAKEDAKRADELRSMGPQPATAPNRPAPASRPTTAL